MINLFCGVDSVMSANGSVVSNSGNVSSVCHWLIV